MSRNVYDVSYRMYFGAEESHLCVIAGNKAEAYDTAFYEAIPKANEGCVPYSAWVTGVTYQNGNYRYFNTCEGLGY